MNTSSLFLNHDNPLSYVDPGVARQMSILTYLTAGALAVRNAILTYRGQTREGF